MTTSFEIAASNNEFPEYFRGTGQYFTRDPDWGTQLHIINWQELCAFLKTHATPGPTLKQAFSEYLGTVEATQEDASSLLENIGCYYYMRKKSPALSSNGFDLVRDMTDEEKQTLSRLIRFLRNEMTTTATPQALQFFNVKLARLVRDGGPENIEDL
ncbi:hypothetical protein [Pseudomonas purpurea]|uniref:hypothetical protein n=1 Tax=Pseudomonas purpurea TaxID=3136737 RepID=UPI003267B8B0